MSISGIGASGGAAAAQTKPALQPPSPKEDMIETGAVSPGETGSGTELIRAAMKAGVDAAAGRAVDKFA